MDYKTFWLILFLMQIYLIIGLFLALINTALNGATKGFIRMILFWPFYYSTRIFKNIKNYW
jgi:uncharacterized membrane protein YiaA